MSSTIEKLGAFPCLAADHPDVVRRLAPLSTGCRLSPKTRADIRRIAARIRSGAPRRALAVAASVILPHGPWQLPAARVAAVLGPHALAPADLAELATTIELEDAFDLAMCARPIRAPTLVISGARDRFYPVSLLEETAASTTRNHRRATRGSRGSECGLRAGPQLGRAGHGDRDRRPCARCGRRGRRGGRWRPTGPRGAPPPAKPT